jgi:putative ABC transport system permease protein
MMFRTKLGESSVRSEEVSARADLRDLMTLVHFVAKNAFRNKRRSALTALSIAFSLLLLTMMMTIWRGFYIDQGAPDSALRIMTRHRVSLAFFLPSFYREKIRAVPGVVHVAPMTWFGGRYKDDRPENFFAQFATDPTEYMEVAADKVIPPEQVKAWQHDQTGCLVDQALAAKHGWKLGDRIVLQGTIFPTNLELTIRGIYTIDPPNNSLYFNAKYLEESVSWFKDTAGFYFTRVDSPAAVARVTRVVDDMFHNLPAPTKSESEKAFQLDFIATLGNVKAFILSICGAVVFTILIVSANTMAMSIRERTREVAVLRTLGFTRRRVLSLYLGESVTLAVIGGLLGVLLAAGLMYLVGKSPVVGVPAAMKVTFPIMVLALVVAAFVGLMSALIPSYNASRRNIVDGLRHIG